jgi:signal transduction histidine kinase
MLAFALTGISLGVLVSQRRRAVYVLQDAERMLEKRLERYAAHLDDDPASRSAGEAAAGPSSPAQTASDTSEDLLRQSTARLVALNESLLDAEASLREMNDRKDRFLSVISHDLKTPLFGIRGLSDVLLDQVDTERQRHLLGLIHQSSSQALTLLENLLTWARLQTGSLSVDHRPLSLASAIDDSFELLDSHALQKDVRLTHDVPSSLQVSADEFVVDTVLRNLISNAIKFTPAGGTVAVAVDADDHEASGGGPDAPRAVVAVSDSGVGIAPDRRASLFDLNPADSTAGTDDEVGTGLGLHVCHELLATHGGDIWVESERGVGSTFFFTLPVSSPSRDGSSAAASSRAGDGADASSDPTVPAASS